MGIVSHLLTKIIVFFIGLALFIMGLGLLLSSVFSGTTGNMTLAVILLIIGALCMGTAIKMIFIN